MADNLHLIELALTCRTQRKGPMERDEWERWNHRILEASGGRNEIVLDEEGFPSMMVHFAPERSGDLIEGGGSELHPAFVVEGKAVRKLLIGKYPCCRLSYGGRDHFLSLRGMDTAHHIGYDDSVRACASKGKNWHMVSNAEYAYLALKCRASGFEPHGNTWYGTYAFDASETGVITDFYDCEEIIPGRCLTGSGPLVWSHDGSPTGVYELNGNVWEWASGLRMVDGQLQVLKDNDAASEHADLSASSDQWRALSESGDCVGQEAASLHFNWNVERERWELGVERSVLEGKYNCAFADVRGSEAALRSERLKLLGLYPAGSEARRDCFFACGAGERLAARGGSYIRGETSGVFALLLTDGRDRVDSDRIGFRLGYVL